MLMPGRSPGGLRTPSTETSSYPWSSKPFWTGRHLGWAPLRNGALPLPGQQAGHVHTTMLADECAAPGVRDSPSRFELPLLADVPRGIRHSGFLNGRASSRAFPPLKEPPWKLDLFVANETISPTLCFCLRSAALLLEETRHVNARNQPAKGYHHPHSPCLWPGGRAGERKEIKKNPKLSSTSSRVS